MDIEQLRVVIKRDGLLPRSEALALLDEVNRLRLENERRNTTRNLAIAKNIVLKERLKELEASMVRLVKENKRLRQEQGS